MLRLRRLIARAVSANEPLARTATVSEFSAMSALASARAAAAAASKRVPKEGSAVRTAYAASPAMPPTRDLEKVQITTAQTALGLPRATPAAPPPIAPGGPRETARNGTETRRRAAPVSALSLRRTNDHCFQGAVENRCEQDRKHGDGHLRVRADLDALPLCQDRDC